MREPTYREVELFDGEYKTLFIQRMSDVCATYSGTGQAKGVFAQFRTDWSVDGLTYALRQSLRYVGYGYTSAMVFYDLGVVAGEMLERMGR